MLRAISGSGVQGTLAGHDERAMSFLEYLQPVDPAATVRKFFVVEVQVNDTLMPEHTLSAVRKYYIRTARTDAGSSIRADAWAIANLIAVR